MSRTIEEIVDQSKAFFESNKENLRFLIDDVDINTFVSNSSAAFTDYITNITFGKGYNGIQLYSSASSYSKDQFVKYINTTGNINIINASYFLRAKESINSGSFDIFDWEIIGHKSWILDRVTVDTEKYEIFPGDVMVINGEKIIVPNTTSGIITSDILLTTYELSNNRHIGSGVSSIQLTEGQNIIYADYPVFFDEASYGIIDNHIVNGGRGNYVLFDNLPEDFELYFKITVDGNPTKRSSYPELPSSFYTRFYFTSTHFPLIETGDFTVVNSGLFYTQVPLTFNNDGDFYYFKFWKTPLMPKVKFTKYTINTTPNIP